jgi:hypothetical protein
MSVVVESMFFSEIESQAGTARLGASDGVITS